ncbi:MAG TPA: hypothetical protein VH583_09930 [Vicinamibacterales bacterium]|jgi:hypothetical protein
MPRIWLVAGAMLMAMPAGSRAGAPELAALLTSAQIDAGYSANVVDCKIAESYSSGEDLTDVTLGLAPPIPADGPGITLLFRARFRGRSTSPDRLVDLSVRAHYRIHSDDRVRSARSLDSSQQLHMDLDRQEASGGISLDFFPTSWGYGGFSAPGDEIPVAYFAVTTADLRALSIARTVSGHVLWTDFTLTDAERDALHQYAGRVLKAGR